MAIHQIKVGTTTHDLQIGASSATNLAVDGTNLGFNGSTIYFSNDKIEADCATSINLGATAGNAYLSLLGGDGDAFLYGYHGLSLTGGGPRIQMDGTSGIQIIGYEGTTMQNVSVVGHNVKLKAMNSPINLISSTSTLASLQCTFNEGKSTGWVEVYPGTMDCNNLSTELSVGAHPAFWCARPISQSSSLSALDYTVLCIDGLFMGRNIYRSSYPDYAGSGGAYGFDFSNGCGIRLITAGTMSSTSDCDHYGLEFIAKACEMSDSPQFLFSAINNDSDAYMRFTSSGLEMSTSRNFNTGNSIGRVGTFITNVGGTYTAIGSKATLFPGAGNNMGYCMAGLNPSNCVVVASGFGYLSSTSTYSNAASTSFIVIDGSSSTSRRNSLRVASGKLYLKTAYQSSGAGITELFEWLDGNPDNEDRVGHFVTLVGEKIRYAEPTDNYVVGAVDPLPSVVGDNGEVWHGMYKRDVFGRALKEKIFVPKEVDELGNVLWEDHYEEVEIQGEDFDPEQPFIERWERQEYSTISSKGKVVLIDDGTCQVDKFATVGPGGIATHSDDNVAVRVMKRIDENHVRVFIDAAFLIKH